MVMWIIGLSGAGKTTLAAAVAARAREAVPNVVLIDGDMIRELFGHDLGFSLEDRKKNADRICRLCKFLDDQGIHVVCAILSLFGESRVWNRKNVHSYYEVFIDTPFEDLVKRDPKGLYRRVLAGEITSVAGVDIPFHPPDDPDLVIRNTGTAEELLAHAPRLAAQILGRPA